MTVTRTPTAATLPLTIGEAKMHARIDHHEEDDSMAIFIGAAAADIEEAAALALLPQTITYETLPAPGRVIPLPIGPAVTDEDNAVEALAEDGTATTLSGWTLTPGNRPRVELAETPEHRVRITYRAQLAATPADLPSDVKHAIADQACRYWQMRGPWNNDGPSLSAHAARVIARYRGVRA